MTDEQVDRAIQFLLDQQAKSDANIERLGAKIDSIASDVQALTNIVAGHEQTLSSVVIEMRDGSNNLIVANEVTRKLAEDVARLVVQTSHRVTNIESKLP